MREYESLTVEIDDHIAHLRFNRPQELNSMNPAFWREFPLALKSIDDSAEAHVVLISSTGKHFTAGMDLAAFSFLQMDESLEIGRQRERFRDIVLQYQSAFNQIEAIRQPVIAAIQGGCIGGGVSLISACDMRLCTEDAFFSIEEINIGLACDVGALQRLPAVISQSLLREWAYTGDRLNAGQAREWGLVSRSYPNQDEMLDGALDLARRIAAKSPLAIRGIKESLNFARDHSVAEGLAQIALWQAGMLHATDPMEALNARKEKRDADFADLLEKTNTN